MFFKKVSVLPHLTVPDIIRFYFLRYLCRKHTGARPYLCRGCGKYYPLLETAQKHTRIFHSGDYSLIIYDIQKDINNPYVSLG
jgi:hypothetical protein